MRVVSGGRFTVDGRWVVVAAMYGAECIVFDPGNNDPWTDLQDCLKYVKERELSI